jgi:hypothetical protein
MKRLKISPTITGGHSDGSYMTSALKTITDLLKYSKDR